MPAKSNGQNESQGRAISFSAPRDHVGCFSGFWDSKPRCTKRIRAPAGLRFILKISPPSVNGALALVHSDMRTNKR